MTNQTRQRAAIYRLLSSLYRREVDAALLKKLGALTFPAQTPEGAPAPVAAWLEAGRAMAACAADLGEGDLEALAVDFARTFLGAGLAEAKAAFPYESIYTSPKRIIMQDAWSRMHELLGNRKLEVADPAAELMEDHISVELAYMAWLCETADETQQADFAARHLANWVPQLCADVTTYAREPFYKACAALLEAFVAYDLWVLRALTKREETAPAAEAPAPAEAVCCGFAASMADMEAIFAKLREVYDVYGPIRARGRGTEEEKTVVRFGKLESLSQLVLDVQSDFSAKEIYYPISQSLFRFDENNYNPVLPKLEKPVLILAHPCDINAITRLDNIFLKNGGQPDIYYKTLRDNVKFGMLECGEGYPGCWCVSMGTNRTDEYALALRMAPTFAMVQVRDAALLPFFAEASESEYTPAFVEKNQFRQANLPRVAEVKKLQDVFDLPFWKEFNDQCISCGGCNTVCPTCSCYETADHLDQENSRRGERRRVWSSCMVPDFTRTAGGHVARPEPAQLMRFKVLHKVYDYNARFGGEAHMCVGCGRCVLRCPENIDFLSTINRLHDETERLIAQQEA